MTYVYDNTALMGFHQAEDLASGNANSVVFRGSTTVPSYESVDRSPLQSDLEVFGPHGVPRRHQFPQ